MDMDRAPEVGNLPNRDSETIFALDNVPLELPIAGAASRSLAASIDYVLLGMIGVLWLLAAMFLLSLGLEGGWLAAVAIGGLFLLDWGYFAGCELAFGGRTPGKIAIGLRVVSRTGGKAAPAAILVRNVVRLVDLFVGVPVMAADPLARRLGDRLAGTLVLRRVAAPPEVTIARVPQGWGAREIAFVEALLERLDELSPERAQELSRRALLWIQKSDPSFLPRIDDDDPAQALRRAFLTGLTGLTGLTDLTGTG
jgi:uncharacterized RDD family membrane protein YckC